MLAAVKLLPKLPTLLKRLPWVPFAIIAGLGLLGETPLMKGLEWRSLDWRTQLRTHFQPAINDRIAVILFDDATEEVLGEAWPVKRDYHAELIRLLALSHARVVSWDVILDASREGAGDPLMAGMVEAASQAGTRTVSAAVTNPEPTGVEAGSEGLTKPLRAVHGDIRWLTGDAHAFVPFPELRAVSLYGFADTPAEADGVRRQIPLVVRVGEQVFPSLALQTLLAYYGVSSDAVRVKLGEAIYFEAGTRHIRMPVTRDGRFLLNYRYDRDAEEGQHVPTYAYGSVLLGLNQLHMQAGAPAVPPPDFSGKVILVGQAVSGKADAGPTQLNGLSPLVYVHANLINNVLAGDFARRVPAAVAWAGVLILGWLGAWVGRRARPRMLAFFSLAVVLAYIALALVLWINASWWLALVAPAAALIGVQFYQVVLRVLQEQRDKEQIRGMFNAYLSPELLNRVMAKGGLQQVDSERKAVTIMFSDLRDFTSWSERTEEHVLIGQLNEYLAAMVECIHENGGTLHKFIGDAVMAVWGDLASEGESRDAERACHAALAMQTRLERLNHDWSARGLATLRMGIGLNHGTVLAGNIGSPRRMEFTVIGDAVNLASRLEALNKELKTSILVGDSVADLLKCGPFKFRSVGGVSIKGKLEQVNVSELLA